MNVNAAIETDPREATRRTPDSSTAKTEAAVQRLRQRLGGGIGSGGRFEHRDLFIQAGKGAHVTDLDGNSYIDYMLAFGPLILGHAPDSLMRAINSSLATGTMFGAACEAELLLSEEVVSVLPCAERVRFTNSGSEAVHAAIRLARAATGRTKVLKFEGHFHGWLDNIYLSVKPLGPQGLSNAPWTARMAAGQPASVVEDVVVATWNDPKGFTDLMSSYGNDIACIILEPYPTNNGCMEAAAGFLELTRQLATQNGSILIFDEVVSGFRLALGGAQQVYGVFPDLCVFGKAFAGGLPIAGFAGNLDLMRLLDGNQVTHLGTYNSNALCAAGALAILRELKEGNGMVLDRIRDLGLLLKDGFNRVFAESGVAMCAEGPGSVITVFAAPTPPTTYRETLSHNARLLAKLHRALLTRGIWAFARGNFMVSAAHNEGDILETIAVMSSIVASGEIQR